MPTIAGYRQNQPVFSGNSDTSRKTDTPPQETSKKDANRPSALDRKHPTLRDKLNYVFNYWPQKLLGMDAAGEKLNPFDATISFERLIDVGLIKGVKKDTSPPRVVTEEMKAAYKKWEKEQNSPIEHPRDLVISNITSKPEKDPLQGLYDRIEKMNDDNYDPFAWAKNKKKTEDEKLKDEMEELSGFQVVANDTIAKD